MNHRRAAVTALAAAGLLALAACGDPDSPQQALQAAQQQPERGAAEANQRMLDAHRNYQQAFEDAAAVAPVHYVPASPDQIERRAVAAAGAPVHYPPASADHVERRAVGADGPALWWTQKR